VGSHQRDQTSKLLPTFESIQPQRKNQLWRFLSFSTESTMCGRSQYPRHRPLAGGSAFRKSERVSDRMGSGCQKTSSTRSIARPHPCQDDATMTKSPVRPLQRPCRSPHLENDLRCATQGPCRGRTGTLTKSNMARLHHARGCGLVFAPC
jgi:hypothetical protein